MVFLLIWGGAKLLVSSRHRVSARSFFFVTVLYLLALSGYTLIARVSLGGGELEPYMDYVSRQARYAGYASGNEYAACLQRSTGAGGMLGMLIAWPLSQILTRVGACLLVGALMVLLLLSFLRLHPGQMLRAASGLGERLREKRAKRQEEQPIPVEGEVRTSGPIYSNTSSQPEETAPPDYYRAGPIYDVGQAVQPPKPDEQGFYPVQPDLYEERFPVEEKRTPIEEPEWRKAAAPVLEEPEPMPEKQEAISEKETVPESEPVPEKEEKPKPLASILKRLKETGPISKQKAVLDLPQAEEKEPPEEKSQPIETEPPVETPKAEKKAPAPVLPPKPTPILPPKPTPVLPPRPAPSGQALDDEDDLPWEVPEGAVVKTVPSKTPANVPAFKPAPPPASPESGPAVPPPQAAAASWAAQVNQKKAALEMPEHTTAKDEPKQVFTDPVMPITG